MTAEELHKLDGNWAPAAVRRGPFRLVVVKDGANKVQWRMLSAASLDVSAFGAYLSRYNSEDAATLACQRMNDAYTLWCMVRGTAAEKEYFP